MLGSFWGNLLTFIFLSIWTYTLIIKKRHSDKYSMAICAATGLVCEAASIFVENLHLSTVINIGANINLAIVFALVYLFVLSSFDKEKSFFLFLLYIAIWNIIGLIASIASGTTIGNFSPVACIIYAILNIAAFILYRYMLKDRVVKFVISMKYNMTFINIISIYVILLMLSFMLLDFFSGGIQLYTIIFLLISLPVLILLYAALTKGLFKSIHNTEDYQSRLRNEVLNEAIVSNNIRGYYEKAYAESKRILYELAKDKDSDSIVRYLKENKLKYEVPFILSTNDIINNVLSAIFVEAQSHDVDFEVDCRNIEKLYVDEYDITSLLANTLDFALKGAMTVKENAYLDISIIQNGEKIYIRGKNTLDGVIRYYDGVPSGDHFDDLGIKIMLEIIEKYGGDFEFENDDEYFYYSFNLINDENRIFTE